MNSIIPSEQIAVLILYEDKTKFVSVWRRKKSSLNEFGRWVLMELGNISLLCHSKDIEKPDIRFIPTKLSQAEYDSMEVEELLCHSNG